MTRTKIALDHARYAVVVMGMHRSGTSAMAGLLARLGCAAPQDLMPAGPQNPKGFYESLSISGLNDALFASAGSAWYTWQGFNPDWFNSPKAAEFMDLAQERLTAVFGASRLIVLKDPRICLLTPFWNAALEQSGYQPLYLHTHRAPLEVAGSLSTWAAVAHDRLPGYSPHYGQLLWLRHVLDSEAETRGLKRHFTSYSRLLADWERVADRAAKGLGLTWPATSERIHDEIGEFVDKSLHRERLGTTPGQGQLRLIPWAGTAHAILERWAETGEDPADFPTLDGLRAALDQATSAFSPLVEAGRHKAHALVLKEEETAQAQTLLAEHQAALAEANAASQQIRARLEESESAYQHGMEEARQKRSLLEEAFAAAQAECHALTDQKAQIASALAQRSHEAEDVGNQLALVREERDRLTRQAEVDAEAHAALSSHLAARDQEIADRDTQLALARQERDRLTRQAEVDAETHAALTNRLAERDQQAADLDTQLALARQEIQRIAAAKTESDAQSATLQEEQKQLKEALETRQNTVTDLTAKISTGQNQILALRHEIEGLQTTRASHLRELRNEKLRHAQVMRDQLTEALRETRRREDEAQHVLARITAENQALSQREDEIRQRHSAAEQHVQALLNSTSWRLTRPLRSMVLALRGRAR